MEPASRQLPVWASDPEVREARRAVEKLRRARRPTADAEKALADAYAKRQQAAVDDAIRAVASVGPDRRNRVVWPVVNALTGRKKKAVLNLAGDTAEERRNELLTFFAAIVNAPPPTLPNEPSEVALPREEDFDTRPVTSADVVEFARRAPEGRSGRGARRGAASHEGCH